jgi:hypothetical protein
MLAEPMRSWSSAEGAEAGARTWWWSAGAGKSRMESSLSGKGALRLSWGRKVDASRASEKGSVPGRAHGDGKDDEEVAEKVILVPDFH